ncbi:hypothetical protein D1AOALGA4SA_9836 [Olavius algarvensis Delta 1 endosymbiont]|nr:hypothetical protein D1AOALGA4SA_9836 [Olavius algarvensis Delta 1 endosymbiont]
MNDNKQFEKKVLKPAIKEARRYRKKHGKLPDESVIKELKIQIINPFIRILSASFGNSCCLLDSFQSLINSLLLDAFLP